MTKIPFDEDEPLLDETGPLLAGVLRDVSPPNALRETLRRRTCAEVQGRMRRRRFVLGGALAASYLAGFLTFQGMATRQMAVPSVPQVAWHVVPTSTIPASTQTAAAQGPVLTEEILRDPERFARLVSEGPIEQRRAFLRAAGDWYLKKKDDIVMATNCYRRYLSLTPNTSDADATINDTWLLDTLRQTNEKESFHAQSNL